MAQLGGIFVVVFLVFVGHDLVFVDAVCPSTAQEAEMQAKTCLRRIGMDVQAGRSMANDFNQMDRYCRDGTMDRALECVEEILGDCKSQSKEVADTMDKLINVDRLKSGFKYMCDNLQVIIENKQCIAQQQEGLVTCVQTEMQKTERPEGQPTQEEVYRITCDFMNRMFTCQYNLYEAGCGKEIAEIMYTSLQTLTPPVCDDYSGAATLSLSWSLLASLLSLFILYTRE